MTLGLSLMTTFAGKLAGGFAIETGYRLSNSGSGAVHSVNSFGA